MHPNTLNDQELVKKCLIDLCHKAGFADPQKMVQRDLEFLCERIESATGVLISLSTIKRLLNGQFSRLPQIATLNAISQFLGFQNWQEYTVSVRNLSTPSPLAPLSSPPSPSRLSPPTPGTSKPKTTHSRRWVIGILLILVTSGLVAGLKFGKPHGHNFEKTEFSATKTTSNNMPNTVVFHYNVDDIEADSFFIQQSWDRNRRVRIDKKDHVLTDIYYEPGYHTAKLIANDKIIKSVDVSIPTDRWFLYAKTDSPRGIPKYIAFEGLKEGRLQLTQEQVMASQVDMGKENKYIMAWFPSKIENSSDNFVLNCRIRTNDVKHEACPLVMCEIFCQRYFMYFMSTTKGCTSEISAQFGDHKLDGKTTDLSALGSDVRSWQHMELTVKNRKVSIRINNVEVLSSQYTASSGLITGLGFISNGLCQVDSIDLRTLDGKPVYGPPAHPL